MAQRTSSGLQPARMEQRHPTKIRGTLIIDRQPIAVEIVDISRVGAHLHGSALPGRGEEVVLRAIDLEVVATIMWSHGDACGLNFHRPIDPMIVVRQNPHLPTLKTLIGPGGTRI